MTNYMNGRVPDIEKLLLIKSLTKCDLDWLLSGDPSRIVDQPRLSRHLCELIRTIAKEQSNLVFSDAEIGGNLETRAADLLVEMLLNKALTDYQLTADDMLSAADRKRANRFTFIANAPQTLDERVRELIRAERVVQTPVQDLGEVDAPFDVRAAVERYDNPVLVMRDWFAHDRIPDMPHVIMPSGWATMTLDEKVSEIRGLRAIIERQRKRKDYAPKLSKAS